MVEDSKEYELYSEIINDVYLNVDKDLANEITSKLSDLVDLLENKFSTGIQLMAKERKEQIEKHGRTIESDIKENDRFQLMKGAKNLLFYCDTNLTVEQARPWNWNPEIWHKMFNNFYKERLIISGSLLAAEIDRITAIENSNSSPSFGEGAEGMGCEEL